MSEKTIKVLVVEDSLVFRNLLVSAINQAEGMQVVAQAGNPYEARDAIIKYNPDVMTLDVELPRMDGIEFLRKLMPQFPVRTVMISALSERVFDALQVGALDFVAKPQTTNRAQLMDFLKNDLPEKLRAASTAKLRTSYGSLKREKIEAVQGENQETTEDSEVIVAIGASTGGTEATAAIIEGFSADIPGVVVTQHMPEGFTKMYADRLNSRSSVSVKEAQHGDPILAGHVYIAPGGDRHMEITKKNGQYFIVLKESEKVNGHRPSVDVLFESVAKEAGDKAVGVILTGMGGDGAKGLLSMRRKGAKTIGQDESTCVVYGMPKVAYELGAVESQEKLLDIAKKVYYFVDQIKRKR